MAGLLERFIQQEDQRRQHGNAADDPQKNALCHDDTKVKSQSEGHEAQGNESGDGGDGAPDHGGEGVADGGGHSLFMIGELLPFFVVAVPEEDGVVHGHGQLQNGGEGFGDVGDLAHEVVGAEV